MARGIRCCTAKHITRSTTFPRRTAEVGHANLLRRGKALVRRRAWNRM
jgi:hypothetical protein